MHGLAAVILALTALTTPNDSISLRSGDAIPVSGQVTLDGNRAVFRHADGTLYSIPLDEIDVAATEAPGRPAAAADRRRTAAENQVLDELTRAARARSISSRTLVVSDEEKQRLLVELRESRGTPEPSRPYVPLTFASDSPAGETLTVSKNSDEWYWREKARGFQEQVRRRREDLQMLIDKERDLSDEILGLLSRGYNGNQFSYQVMSLARTRDLIPLARLEVERAERELAQFMDDARRQSILPGWLR